MLAKTLKALLLLCLIQAARTVADPVKAALPARRNSFTVPANGSTGAAHPERLPETASAWECGAAPPPRAPEPSAARAG